MPAAVWLNPCCRVEPEWFAGHTT